MERAAHQDKRVYSMQVALDDSDMVWIAATIDALGKPALKRKQTALALHPRLEAKAGTAMSTSEANSD
jgi:hypothetical protein